MEKKLPEDPSPRLPRPYFIFFLSFFFSWALIYSSSSVPVAPFSSLLYTFYILILSCLATLDLLPTNTNYNTAKMVEKLYVTYNDVSLRTATTPPPRLDDEGRDAHHKKSVRLDATMLPDLRKHVLFVA
jgi:hypothetical protein